MSARPAVTLLNEVWRCFGSALLALVLVGGCATGQLHGNGPAPLSQAPALSPDPSRMGRPTSSPAQEEATGGAGGFFEQEADAFQVVQEGCGLEEGARHPVGAALYTPQARELWSRVAQAPVTQKSFGPRLVLSWLLREALAGGRPVAYAELRQRAERFWPLVVVRPDGYLVAALSGRPLQRMGPVEVREGELKAGSLVVGAFYFSRAGVIYPVDDSLRQSGHTPWAELGLERDWLNAALDGAQEAMGELALALARSVLHPIRTVEGLQQLPSSVALLIASSPEYFARYGAMSLQEQIREAARLSTHLLLAYGGSAGTAGTVGRMGALGTQVPVLSLSAKGTLVVRGAVVSAGTVTTTLGAGVGAVAIVHMAVAGSGHGVPPPGGPGQWVQDTSSMSEDARDYQAQVTGVPRGWAYNVCRNGECVEFDGYDSQERCLLEAKGLGYDKWFKADLEPKWNFKGARGLVDQARKQVLAAGGLRIRWHVAEPRMVSILQKLFKAENIEGIEVVYTSPQKLP